MGGVVRSVSRAVSSVVGGVSRAVSSVAGAVSDVAGTVVSSAGSVLAGLLVSTGIASVLSPRPTSRNSSLSQSASSSHSANRSVMAKQPITPREMVFGTTKKSGSILFMEATNNNKELHVVIQIASHEIQSFDTIYFNDEALTLSSYGTDSNGITRYRITAPSKYTGASTVRTSDYKVRIKQHLGTDDQSADADLVSAVTKWTMNTD